MIVQDVRDVLDGYLRYKGAKTLELILMPQIMEAMNCGEKMAKQYLKGLEPIRGSKPRWYSTDQVAERILEVER